MDYKFAEMKIQKSTDYFGLSSDELLEIRNDHGYTREECKLFDDGIEIVFFDNIDELVNEQDDFNKYINGRRSPFEVKSIIETINERLAVVLI